MQQKTLVQMKKLNLSEWALRHQALVLYFMVMLMVSGLWAYTQLGQKEDPEFTFKAMLVQTYWPGAKAVEVEQQISDRLEEKLQEMPEIKDDKGLAVCSFAMAPDARASAPSPDNGDGQYVVVIEGSLMHEGRECKGLTVVFVKPGEKAFDIKAGPRGLRGLILNFMPRAFATRWSNSATMDGDFGASSGWASKD